MDEKPECPCCDTPVPRKKWRIADPGYQRDVERAIMRAWALLNEDADAGAVPIAKRAMVARAILGDVSGEWSMPDAPSDRDRKDDLGAAKRASDDTGIWTDPLDALRDRISDALDAYEKETARRLRKKARRG